MLSFLILEREILNIMCSNIKKIAVLLVFLPVFGTVAPATVTGEDTVFVQNVVQSSSHTGGRGADGTDGADGQDGKDGESGQSGESVHSGESRAVIEYYNKTTNGESVKQVYATTTGTGTVNEHSDVIDTTEAGFATPTIKTIETQEVTDEQQSQLHFIVLALQKLITHYVNLLF